MLPFMLSPRSLLLGLFFMSHNYITDHLGSTRVVLNNAGSVLERYDYYPYGEKVPVTVANTGNTDYLYTGKESQNALFLKGGSFLEEEFHGGKSVFGSCQKEYYYKTRLCVVLL